MKCQKCEKREQKRKKSKEEGDRVVLLCGYLMVITLFALSVWGITMSWTIKMLYNNPLVLISSALSTFGWILVLVITGGILIASIGDYIWKYEMKA